MNVKNRERGCNMQVYWVLMGFCCGYFIFPILEFKKNRMKIILLIISCVFLSNSIIAQHSTDNWFFGMNAGLHFPGPTVISGSSLATTEGKIESNN